MLVAMKRFGGAKRRRGRHKGEDVWFTGDSPETQLRGDPALLQILRSGESRGTFRPPEPFTPAGSGGCLFEKPSETFTEP